MGQFCLTGCDLDESRFPADPGFARNQARGCSDLESCLTECDSGLILGDYSVQTADNQLLSVFETTRVEFTG